MPIDTDPSLAPYAQIHASTIRICSLLNGMDHPPASLLDLATETEREADRMLASARRAAQVRAATEELARGDYDDEPPSAFREWLADAQDGRP